MLYYKLKLRDVLADIQEFFNDTVPRAAISFMLGIGLGVLAYWVANMLWDLLDAMAQNYFVVVGGLLAPYFLTFITPFAVALAVIYFAERR